jgi:hypothetical protein
MSNWKKTMMASASEGWLATDISNTVDTNKNLNFGTTTTDCRGLYMQPDGGAIWAGNGSNGNVHKWSLSTPFDISTGSYSGSISTNPFSLGTDISAPFIGDDGNELFVVNRPNEYVFQYNLSSPYGLSASYDSFSSVAGQMQNPIGMHWKPEGDKMYLIPTGNPRKIFEYDISPNWDLSTLSFNQSSPDTSSQDVSPRALEMSPDGTYAYIFGDSNQSVHQYSMSTAFDVSTLSYSNILFDFGALYSGGNSMCMSSDGQYIYIYSGSFGRVYQFSTIG